MPSLARETAREKTLLEKFNRPLTRWLAGAMLLLTSEGCNVSFARGPVLPEEYVPAPATRRGAYDATDISGGDTGAPQYIPKSQIDSYRRAQGLPTEQQMADSANRDIRRAPDTEPVRAMPHAPPEVKAAVERVNIRRQLEREQIIEQVEQRRAKNRQERAQIAARRQAEQEQKDARAKKKAAEDRAAQAQKQ